MSSLSDLTQAYIAASFSPEQQAVIMRALHVVIDEAQLPSTERVLIDCITMEDEISQDDRRDLFMGNIQTLMYGIIEEYLIDIDRDQDPTTLELVQICEAFCLLNKLENAAPIYCVIYSDRSARSIVVDLVSTLTQLDACRAMELIIEANDRIVDAVRQLYEDKEHTTSTAVQSLGKEKWRLFSGFIQNTPCVGQELAQDMWSHQPLSVLMALSKNAVTYYEGEVSVAKIALDVLSMLMFAHDTQDAPLDHIQRCLSVSQIPTELHVPVTTAVHNIWKDFSLFAAFKNNPESRGAA